MKIIYLTIILLIFGCSPKKGQNADETNMEIPEEETINAKSVKDTLVNKKNLYNELKITVKSNNKAQLLSLLNKGVDVNYIPNQYFDTTLLSLACKEGNLEIVKILIENGANINKGTGEFESYYSPIGASIKGNHLEIVSYIIDKNDTQNLPISFIQEGDTLMIDFLLNKGMDINEYYAIDAEWEVSRLEEAIMKEENELAEYLIEKGAKIDFGVIQNLSTQEQFDMINNSGFSFGSFEDQIKESTGEPDVYSVLSNKSVDRRQLFLDNGFRPSPNTIATLFGDQEALSTLLQHNQTVERFIDLDETYEFHKYIATYYGSETKSIPNYQTTLLGVAVLQNQQEAIKTVLEFGADPNKLDINGNPPIYYASEKNKHEIESLLSKTTDDNNR